MRIIKKYRELISYLFWGVMTTAISWASYSLFSCIFSAADGSDILLSVFFSNILSWLFATMFAFITNKLFVFKSKKWNVKILFSEMGKFVSARILTGALEIVAVPLLVRIGLNQTVLGVSGMLSKIIVSFIVVILNYFISKEVIFKESNVGVCK